MTSKTKGMPTELNTWVLSRLFGELDRISNAVEATAAPHVRRCLSWGWIAVEGRELVLTQEGKAAVVEHNRTGLRAN